MKKLKDLNCDQNQIVTKVKNQIVAILKNSNSDKTQKHKCDKSPILNTHIVTKVKTSNSDKTQI